MKNETMTVTLSMHMWEVIRGAVGEIPTRIGMPVALEINRQMMAQGETHGRSAGAVAAVGADHPERSNGVGSGAEASH